jgi:hypothetical protein
MYPNNDQLPESPVTLCGSIHPVKANVVCVKPQRHAHHGTAHEDWLDDLGLLRGALKCSPP